MLAAQKAEYYLISCWSKLSHQHSHQAKGVLKKLLSLKREGLSGLLPGEYSTALFLCLEKTEMNLKIDVEED